MITYRKRYNRDIHIGASKYWLDKKVISSAGRVTKYKEFPYKYNKFIGTNDLLDYKRNKGDDWMGVGN